MVRVSNLSFGYDKNTIVLNNVSFCADTGAILCIYGRSGSGKTTLAKLICGLLKPQTGTIETSDKPRMVLQFPERQLFSKTVLEDVMYGPLNQGKSKDEAKEIAVKTIKNLGLNESILNKSPFEISGGEKRLVAIAGILAMESPILVLDEPTAGLDAFGYENLKAILKTLKEEGKTIILVSHEAELLDELCTDRIRL